MPKLILTKMLSQKKMVKQSHSYLKYALAWFYLAGCWPAQLVIDLFDQHQRFVVCCPLHCHDCESFYISRSSFTHSLYVQVGKVSIYPDLSKCLEKFRFAPNKALDTYFYKVTQIAQSIVCNWNLFVQSSFFVHFTVNRIRKNPQKEI